MAGQEAGDKYPIRIVTTNADEAMLRIPRHLLVQAEWAIQVAYEHQQNGDALATERLAECDELPKIIKALHDADNECSWAEFAASPEQQRAMREQLERVIIDRPEWANDARDATAILDELARVQAKPKPKPNPRPQVLVDAEVFETLKAMTAEVKSLLAQFKQ